MRVEVWNIMRKRIALCLITLCLVLAGCGKNENPAENMGAASDCDAQNKYRGTVSGVFVFQETEELFLGSSFLGQSVCYYDKASGIRGVLCADPSCTHDSSECGASITEGGFFYAGEGKAYWLQQGELRDGWDYFLYKGDLSGNGRELVKRISMEDVIQEYNPQWYEIHRDRLYVLGQKDIVEGVNTYTRVTLVSTPLEGSDNYTLLFDETFDRAVHPYVRFVGDDIYLTMQIFTPDSPVDVKILRIGTKTGEHETVYEETGRMEAIRPAWVTQDAEIYLPGYCDGHACVWKLENGQRVEVFSWEYGSRTCPDIMDGIAVFTYSEEGIRWIDVIDLSGQLLYSGKLFPEAIPGIEGDPNTCSRTVIGGDPDKLIMNLQSITQNGIVDYTVMLDLKDNLKATVLWSSQD